MQQFEMNFDGLVGPSHNYAGLSFGNVASASNSNAISNPKEAALQGLQKMKALADLGMHQGVLAPQQRPDVATLRRLGFSGDDSAVLSKAAAQAPGVFLACCSASSMWTANAATVSPSADTLDGKTHFTPANLTNKFHRSLEPEITQNILKATFVSDKYFKHHTHLPENEAFGDEGAANHTRLCTEYGKPGVEIFTFGRYAFNQSNIAPKTFPARQTFEASEAIARLHQLPNESVVFVQQNPDVIDQGVFHNDVIAVGNQNVLFFHQQAFHNASGFLGELRIKFGDNPLHLIEVLDKDVSVNDAIKSYLFNTQILTLPSGDMTIIAPTECQETTSVNHYLNELVGQGSTPIKSVNYMDVKQSMRNGGGPACLRLRVALTEDELTGVNPHTVLNDNLYQTLTQWVSKHYRDKLSIEDLQDYQFLKETYSALDELTQILKLGSVYPFQQE